MNSPRVVHLNVSEMLVSSEPVVVSTILGSCVSVCLFCPQTKVGGIIHYALPSIQYASQEMNNNSSLAAELHFGDKAIDRLVHEVSQVSKTPPTQLLAKIIGGAAVVDQLKQSAQIGDLNVKLAEDKLAQLRIRVVGKNVGGTRGRKVLFYTDTGRVRVSLFENSHSESTKNTVKEVKAPSVVKAKKRVLIIDDSKTIRELLSRIFAQDPEIEVVGTAPNPLMAKELVTRFKPDVITLDIHMPGMDGIEFLEKVYPSISVPVVMITSISKEESDAVFRALELGAIDYIQKPRMEALGELGPRICEKVKTAASVKIRKRPLSAPRSNQRNLLTKRVDLDFNEIIAMGASTGGTEALKSVLVQLPKEIPPILVVQHIPPIFSTAFAKRLNDLCEFEVKEAEDGDEVRRGRALIAPGDYHMRVKRNSRGTFVTLDQLAPVQRHRPSVDVLFDSVAQTIGPKAVGIILTGMGSDGAEGLATMRVKGARTIAQDEASCVVFGMPKEAIKLGGVEIISSLEDIPQRLLSLLEKK